VLEGSITRLGSQYVLNLRARACNSGNLLDQEQALAPEREQVLHSLRQIVRQLRTNLGESRALVEMRSTPLSQTTTSSLEALKAYTTGIKVIASSGTGLPYFKRALELDPDYAMANALLGLSYSNMGESLLSSRYTTKAWALRHRVSEPERFFVEFAYDRQATGNLEKAYETLEQWHQTYPRWEVPSPTGLFGGVSTQGTGRFERAIQMTKEAIELDPDFRVNYMSLALAYFYTDRFDEAQRAMQQASERKLFTTFQPVRYLIAMVNGDQAQMEREAALVEGNRAAQYQLAHADALAQARAGGLQAARRLSRRAEELAMQEDKRELAASYRAARAVWEALCGNADEARKSARTSLDLSTGRDVEYTAGLAFGLVGDWSQSEALAASLEKRLPEDTFVRFTYVPVLRALSAVAQGKWEEAVERLDMTRAYELAANGVNFSRFHLGGLHSAYIRGEALLSLRRYPDAAAEFQKILTHRGITGMDPIGALAHWRLGRAFAMSGEKTKAKAAYQSFLTIWKNADPGSPSLKRAKAEYDSL
jgi:tetratricopeptide (TPR) repeat protein